MILRDVIPVPPQRTHALFSVSGTSWNMVVGRFHGFSIFSEKYIPWVWPPPRMPVTTKIITSSVRDPYETVPLETEVQTITCDCQYKCVQRTFGNTTFFSAIYIPKIEPVTYLVCTSILFMCIREHFYLYIYIIIYIYIYRCIWVFPKIVVPQNGRFIMEIPFKMDDLGVPLFSETPICENPCSCLLSLHLNPRNLVSRRVSGHHGVVEPGGA